VGIDVGTRLNNLAELLRTTNRLAEAEPLMRRGPRSPRRAWAGPSDVAAS